MVGGETWRHACLVNQQKSQQYEAKSRLDARRFPTAGVLYSIIPLRTSWPQRHAGDGGAARRSPSALASDASADVFVFFFSRS